MSRQSTPARRPQQSRDKNCNWKGGRVVASNGYVLVKVGFDHHLADVRGYAYEHRVVAEQKLGRRLVDGELVHHVNGNKQDNRPENLEVKASNAEHFFEHRKSERGLRTPGQENPVIQCACGCGELFPKFDEHNRPRKFVTGHNSKNDLADFVLWYLTDVPLPGTTQCIAGTLAAPERLVGKILGKLKKSGMVSRDRGRRGEWRAVSADERSTQP